MQVVTPKDIKNKRVLLRLDIDVPLEKFKIQNSKFKIRVQDDFRLKAGLPTLKLCLKHAKEVIIMGHLGRPNGREVEELSVEPILDWLEEELGKSGEVGEFGERLKILENLRFEKGESFDPSTSLRAQDKEEVLKFAKELASLGDVYINEAFAAYHKSASTTVLPTLLPHFAGLRFAKEVEVLTSVRNYKGEGLIVIIGGAKVEDKLPLIEAMAEKAEMVLVGGKLAKEFPIFNFQFSNNVVVAEINADGTDITKETSHVWKEILLHHAKMIVWNGPVGRIEDSNLQFSIYNLQNRTEKEVGSARGTYELAGSILDSGADIVVGGGDTVGFLGESGLIDEFEKHGFVSTGGGAMLEFLTTGTLDTIEALK